LVWANAVAAQGQLHSIATAFQLSVFKIATHCYTPIVLTVATIELPTLALARIVSP
jgi:hypothetical protein